MPLGLDVEVDVVDAGDELPQALALALDDRARRPSAATGRWCRAWASSGFTDATMRPTRPRGAARAPSCVAHRHGQVADGHQVLVGLRRAGRSCSRASGSRCRSRRSGRRVSRISSLVTVLLITRRRRSEPVSGAIVIDRSPLCAQQPDDGLGQVVEPQRRRADAVAHLDQAASGSARCRGDRRAQSRRGRRGWRAAARPRRSRGCGRSRTAGRAGSCSRPSRTGRGSRSRARLRSAAAIRTRCRA